MMSGDIGSMELDLSSVMKKISMDDWTEALRLLSGEHILPYAAARYDLPGGGTLRIHHKVVDGYPDPRRMQIKAAGGEYRLDCWVRLDAYGRIRHADASLKKAERMAVERLIRQHLLAEAAIAVRPFGRETVEAKGKKKPPRNGEKNMHIPDAVTTVIPEKGIDIIGGSGIRQEPNHQVVQRAHMGFRWKGSKKDGTRRKVLVRIREGIKYKDKPKVPHESVDISGGDDK